MTKILNLDALSGQEERELVLGGKTYKVPAMTVGNFIQTSRIAQELEKNKDATVADQVEAAVDMIVRSVPKAPKEVLLGCSLIELNRITSFIRGDDEEKVEAAAAQEAGKEAPSGN